MTQVKSINVKRINCGDYVHCVVKHVVDGGSVTEQWGEDHKGKETGRRYFEAYVGKAHVMYRNDREWSRDEVRGVPMKRIDMERLIASTTEWGIVARFADIAQATECIRMMRSA